MKFSTRDRALAAVIVALLLCGAFYKFALMPERHQAAHLQSQITTAQSALATAQQQELTGHAAEVALRKVQTDWTAAQRAVPQVADVPGLLKLLTKAAQGAHVTMQSITLSAPTTTAAPTPAAATGTATTASTGTSTTASTGTSTTPSSTGTSTTGASTTSTGLTLTTIPVALTFSGGYQALNRLISHLNLFVNVAHGHIHTAGPLVGISNVSVAPKEDTSDPSELSIQLTASIYQRSGNTEGS